MLKPALLFATLLFASFANVGAQIRTPIWYYPNKGKHIIGVGVGPLLLNLAERDTLNGHTPLRVDGLSLEVPGVSIGWAFVPRIPAFYDTIPKERVYTSIVRGVHVSPGGNIQPVAIRGLCVSGMPLVFSDVKGLALGFMPTAFTTLSGVQVSVFFAESVRIKGGQLAGYRTVADTLKGIQVSIYNRAKLAKGLQFGLVNRADSLLGLQLGLLNFHNGRISPFIGMSRKGSARSTS